MLFEQENTLPAGLRGFLGLSPSTLCSPSERMPAMNGKPRAQGDLFMDYLKAKGWDPALQGLAWSDSWPADPLKG